MFEVGDALEQASHLLPAEDDGQLLLGAGALDFGHHPRAMQDLGEEEKEGAVCLVEGGAGDAPLINQV